MQGYYKDPDQNAQTLRDGYLHTGDMGELSSDGFLKLTGRVKDIFKTTKGEYIVPGKIELHFLSLHEVDQVGADVVETFALLGCVEEPWWPDVRSACDDLLQVMNALHVDGRLLRRPVQDFPERRRVVPQGVQPVFPVATCKDSPLEVLVGDLAC